MADVLFIAALAGFFGLCVLFVQVIDRMIERGSEGARGEGPGDPDDGPVPDLQAAA
jgi:hypothetical protein